ncbi:MAG: undecaprenyl-phosphate glucose phosphotransferase [Alphaproteobacteria bacterium]
MAFADFRQAPKQAIRPVSNAGNGPAGNDTIDNRAPLSIAAINTAQALGPRFVTAPRVAAFARLADFLTIAAIGFAGYLVKGDHGEPHTMLLYLTPVSLIPLLFVLVLGSCGGYDIYALRKALPRISRAAAIWIAVFGSFALTVFFLKLGSEYSRIWLASWFVVGLTSLVLIRIGTSHLAGRWSRAGLMTRRAVIVGSGSEAAELVTALDADGNADIRIHGFFDDRTGDRSSPTIEGYPRLGTIEELIPFGRNADIDLVLVALPLSAENRLAALLKKLWVLPVDIRISAKSTPLRFRPRSYSHIGSVPFLDVFDRPITGWDLVTKRLFDLVVASLAIIALSPLMIAAAILISLDSPGPVLFRQRRYGFNNNVINVLKFRSMYHHMADPAAKVVVTRSDPRVTRVGRFIRRTSIDELPQLFNVLRGDLSLVGPRPHAVNAHTDNQLWERVVDGYFARHRVLPGVTGWAQINGWRGEVDCEEKIRRRVDHDLDYIENWSVLFDIYILLLTPFRMMSGEDVY